MFTTGIDQHKRESVFTTYNAAALEIDDITRFPASSGSCPTAASSPAPITAAAAPGPSNTTPRSGPSIAGSRGARIPKWPAPSWRKNWPASSIRC